MASETLGPGETLRIDGGTSATDATTYFSFGGWGGFGIDAFNLPNGRFVVDNSGKVGISMPEPTSALHLGVGRGLRIEAGNAPTDEVYFSFGGHGIFGIDAPSGANGRFVVDDSGNVGIWMGEPKFGLHLGAGKVLRIEAGPGPNNYFSFGGNGTFGIDAPGVANGRFVVLDSGNVGIGIDTPTSALHVAGDVTVTGDILLTGADCAEHFDVAGAQVPEPGTVVVVDDCGALRESRTPYDKKVAGVVSGAGEYKHALILDNRVSEKRRVAVALLGKVFCKADAQYSPIESGDLLTTSPTPGHAMKATDREKAFGSIIGKALRSLEKGSGLIPILIALQ
jgi:hypothetical protein